MRSANRWLGNLTGIQAPAATTSIGPAQLPRAVNTVYLHSDVMAGARDTMGPVPGQRATIAKISMGATQENDHHAQSLFRPHLFTTLSRQDITRIDFSLCDSRGVTLDLQGTRLAFVITFDNPHLVA